jgi:putative transposase
MAYTPTILGQVINQASRLDFTSCVKDNHADKYVKSLFSWNLFVLLVFGHLAEVKSMRHLILVFNSATTKLYHLGCGKVSLNTLSNALAQRPSDIFRDFFYRLLSKTPREKTKVGRNFNKFVSIVDATCMPMKGKGSEWAKGGKSRQEARAHVLIDPSGMPLDMVVSGASVHEIKGMSGLDLSGTEVLVMDRGYYSFDLWRKLDKQGIIFVTRAKRDMYYKVVSNRRGRRPKGVVEDQEVRFDNPKKRDVIKDLRMRRIVFVTGKRKLTFLTNDLESPANVICELYRSRWEIEVFFKWIKQNLKIKRFYGRNKNAIECQLWVAMIVYLLIYTLRKNISYQGTNLILIRDC